MAAITYGVGAWLKESEYSESAVLTLYDDEGQNIGEYYLSIFGGGRWDGFSLEKDAFNAVAAVADLSLGEVKRALIEATANYLEANREEVK